MFWGCTSPRLRDQKVTIQDTLNRFGDLQLGFLKVMTLKDGP